MSASGGNLETAGNRVPSCLSPLDCALVRHFELLSPSARCPLLREEPHPGVLKTPPRPLNLKVAGLLRWPEGELSKVRFAEGRVNHGAPVSLVDSEPLVSKLRAQLGKQWRGIHRVAKTEQNLLARLRRRGIRGSRYWVHAPHRILGNFQSLQVPKAEDQAVVLSVLGPKLKRANVFDSFALLKLTFEKLQQTGRTLLSLKWNRNLPLIRAKKRGQSGLLPLSANETMDERHRQEEERLATREIKEPARDRHRCARIAKGVDKGKGWNEMRSFLDDRVDHRGEGALELPVLHVHRNVARKFSKRINLPTEVLHSILVMLDEKKDEVNATLLRTALMG